MTKPKESKERPLVLFQQINSKSHAMHPIKNDSFIAVEPFRGNARPASKKRKE